MMVFKRHKTNRITPKNVRMIENLKEKNYSFYEIGKKLGFSVTAVRYWYLKENDPERFEKEAEVRRQNFLRWYNNNKNSAYFRRRFNSKK